MKRNILLLAFSLIITIAAMISSCSHFKREINEVNPAFGKYISAYTSGMVSRKNSIRIELAKGYFETHPVPGNTTTQDSSRSLEVLAALASLPDSTLLDGIFSFEPALPGKAIWISDRVIEYIPNEMLPVNQFYNVKFKLDRLVETEDELETFRFQFSTYPQNLFVTIDGIRSYDDYNIEWQKRGLPLNDH